MLILQAGIREHQLNILDLPFDLLKHVLNAVDNIWHLQRLAQVASVSKSFAAVLRQQQYITVFSRDLPELESGRYFSALRQLSVCFECVTTLELREVEETNAMQMLQLGSTFEGLTTLDVCMQNVHYPLAAVFFQGSVLSGAASLQKLLVRHDTVIQLKVESPEGPLRQHDWLACITAGSLGVLRVLVRLADTAAFGGSTDVTAQTDQKTLSLLPALQWLEIGDEPLLTSFKGTVRGELTDETADTFLEATVGHVTGIGDHDNISFLDLTRPLSSIRSWHSESLSTARFITQVAPNLTVLNIKISNSIKNRIVLTPKMVSVDVSKPACLGPMSVHGIPNTGLTHLCIQAHTLWVDQELYIWVKARQPQPYYADHDVQVEVVNNVRCVVMTSVCLNTTVSLQC